MRDILKREKFFRSDLITFFRESIRDNEIKKKPFKIKGFLGFVNFLSQIICQYKSSRRYSPAVIGDLAKIIESPLNIESQIRIET